MTDRPIPPESFTVDVDVDGARVVVVPHGEIDAYTAPRLREALHGVGDAGGRHVVVDLGDVGFIDSAGLSALVGALRSVRETGGAMTLRSLTRQHAKLFEITGLAGLFAIE